MQPISIHHEPKVNVTPAKSVLLSIVTTLYYSAPYLAEFHKRITAEVRKLTQDYEIILVNDGSPDESLSLAISFLEQDEHITVIDLSRNFGHHKAIMTGLAHAKGDLVFLIDCDLEEEPEILGTFYEAFKKHDVDVVFALLETRKGQFFERIGGSLFYRIFNVISDTKVHPRMGLARIMSRRFVDVLVQHREQELMLGALWNSIGFEQLYIPIQKRNKGATTYSVRRKLALAVRAITSFSNRPLVFIAYLGAVILLISIAYTLYLLALYFLTGRVPEGYTSLIVSIWLLGGLIIFCVGIVAIYLSVVFVEVKQRPYTIIRNIYRSE